MEIERGRIQSVERDYHFSGPPPRQWGCRLSKPPQDDESEEIRPVLEALIKSWRGQVWLCYSAVVSHRITIDRTLVHPVRHSSAWSLTGWLVYDGSRPALPLGWSGRGNGLDWLKSRCATELRRLADMLSRAGATAAGATPAVLSPAASAVLVHEIVGHTAEASPSRLSESDSFLGCRIASELLSFSDDPQASEGPVRYEYDDESVRSPGATVIVRDGVLVAQLHSQATAEAASTLSTANGRAASAWDTPVPRVSNLVCQAEGVSEDELTGRIKDGLYIERLANGINNGASISAEITLAERIKDGRRTGKFVSGGRIEERLGMLLRVVKAGNNSLFHSNSICGKAGQLLFNVGTCAPSLRFTHLRILS
jgi:predicted Zn-dependent protease